MAKVKVEGATVPTDATIQSRPDLFGVRGQFRPDGDGGIESYMMDDKPEYATPQASQVESGFYVGDRGLPWHVTLSKMLGETPLMKDAGRLLRGDEAYAAAGGFAVGIAPATRAGSDLVVPGKFVTFREDTGAPLGVVGRTWKAFQERDLIAFTDEIVALADGNAYETGAHLYGGTQFLVSMELGGLDVTVPGDPSGLRTYLLARTSHDGSTPTSLYVTTVRFVCKNTADLARKGALTSWSIRHNAANPAARLVEARKALAITVRSVETIKALTSHLALAKVVDAQVMDILKAAWPVRGKDGEAVADKQNRNVDLAFSLYEASPNLDGIRGTAWGAYNAVTEYVDHAMTYRGRTADAADVRADSILFTVGHDTKERALKAALELAK